MVENQKKRLHLEKDFFALIVLCYLKENQIKYQINPKKQAQLFYTAIFINITSLTMLACMFQSLLTNEADQYYPIYSHSFAVFIVKIPCTMALHLALYPEVANGMFIMKFANN